MKTVLRKWLSIVLCVSLLSTVNAPHGQAASPAVAQGSQSIDDLLKQPYLEVLRVAPTVHFSGQQFQDLRKKLDREEKGKKDELKTKQKNLEKQIREAQSELKKLSVQSPEESSETAARRHDLH
ncbi:MAG: hypothetical protein HY648_13070, partial [Acidobacteria bacterium]|nr:hypothetical protein [Acidobacteriota bacterium]